MQENRLRILTYNIHKGFSAGNRRFILHQLREALIQSDADILFLQEMQGQHSKHEKRHHNWPDCSQIEFIAKDVWSHSAYGKNAVYKVGHHGNAILSKYPLTQCENINISPVSWASRSLLHAAVALPGLDQDLHIICIHLGLIGMERRRQFGQLCDRIDQHISPESPLIIAGDFNDWTGQAEKRLSRHLELKEAYKTLHNKHARTWPVWLPLLKMDRIYYRGIKPILCDRPSQSVWKNLSDHSPLLATFNF
jgi:endonuclease/exonuclease/phosphatase family metal-dependent hydrolase